MRVSIDKAGRVVIPSAVRERLSLSPGAELELTLDGSVIRLERQVAGPRLAKRGKRLVARPTAKDAPELDLATLLDEERSRWPL